MPASTPAGRRRRSSSSGTAAATWTTPRRGKRTASSLPAATKSEAVQLPVALDAEDDEAEVHRKRWRNAVTWAVVVSALVLVAAWRAVASNSPVVAPDANDDPAPPPPDETMERLARLEAQVDEAARLHADDTSALSQTITELTEAVNALRKRVDYFETLHNNLKNNKKNNDDVDTDALARKLSTEMEDALAEVRDDIDDLRSDVLAAREEASIASTDAKQALDVASRAAAPRERDAPDDDVGALVTEAKVELLAALRKWTELDGTGLPDVANARAGGSVHDPDTTPTYWPGSRVGLLASGIGPDIAISSSQEDACWPCDVRPGPCRLGVRLSRPSRIQAVSLEFPPSEVAAISVPGASAPHQAWTSPPRSFRVWFRRAGLAGAVSDTLELALDRAEFAWGSAEGGDAKVQTFSVGEEQSKWEDVVVVVLEVLSAHPSTTSNSNNNHASPLACVGRFRVHPF